MNIKVALSILLLATSLGASAQRRGRKVAPKPLTAEELLKQKQDKLFGEMVDNTQLNMFYVSKFMQDCVYYCEDCDAYVIAEEDEELIIDMVISEKEQDLNHIVNCFGAGNKSVILGFTPKNAAGFKVREMNPDDRQMFVKGNGFAGFEEAKVMVPLLAYA